MMDSEELCISIKCVQGEVTRRFRLRANNYKELYTALSAQFTEGITLFWKDDEDDEVIINSAEALEEAHSEAGDLVHIIVKEKQALVENKAIHIQTENTTPEPSVNVFSQTALPASARTEGAVHGALCDVCDAYIIGHRFQCLMCSNFDLCQVCESTGAHSNHAMMRIVDPNVTRIPWGAKFCQNGNPFESKPQQHQKGQPNAPTGTKTADDRFKEITKNGLQFLAEVGSVVTDTLSNFGIDATYEVRGGRDGGKTTGRKEPSAAKNASSFPHAELTTEKKDKKEEKKEEKKMEEKKPEKAEEPKKPFASIYPTVDAEIPFEKMMKAKELAETPIVTKKADKEEPKKKPSRLEEAVAKAKEKKLRGESTLTSDFPGWGVDHRRFSRGFGFDSEDDFFSDKQQRKRDKKEKKAEPRKVTGSFGEFHGLKCICTDCVQRAGYTSRRIEEPSAFGRSSFRSSLGRRGYGGCGFGCDGCPECATFRRLRAENAPEKFDRFGPREEGRSTGFVFGSPFGFERGSFGERGGFGERDGFGGAPFDRNSFSNKSSLHPNPNFGKNPQFGPPRWEDDEREPRDFYFEGRSGKKVDEPKKEEKKETPVKEEVSDKQLVPVSVLVPLMGETLFIQEKKADSVVAADGSTFSGEEKTPFDDLLEFPVENDEGKNTDQESIGSEVVAVEEVDSDGWVDAKENAIELGAEVPTAPVDVEDIPANQLNVDGTFATLLSMGYSDQQARRAISHCGCDLENCLDYISQQ